MTSVNINARARKMPKREKTMPPYPGFLQDRAADENVNCQMSNVNFLFFSHFPAPIP